ncbi:hypothetical protein GWO43_16110 [candidate division KSB1 bacterium]|nr:hypothetical protein [candidate division KSB1 bacterium]NIV68758.1 hypothetical protein [Phycisphaerae bacterium]NIS25475.1 hypothetical protein [candidate division KSB1 bacterium]NIT72368.1 hypothetical protein [candidate division KSB1 bacterium]NIU26152.1 hypothetical protein [candidate division KSB1 bacterium]
MKKLCALILLALVGCSNPDPEFYVDGNFLVIEDKVIYIPAIEFIDCKTFLRDRIIIKTSAWAATYQNWMSFKDCMILRDNIVREVAQQRSKLYGKGKK